MARWRLHSIAAAAALGWWISTLGSWALGSYYSSSSPPDLLQHSTVVHCEAIAWWVIPRKIPQDSREYLLAPSTSREIETNTVSSGCCFLGRYLPENKTHKSIPVEEDTYCYLFLRYSISLSWLLAAIHSTSYLLACLLESSSLSPPPPLLPQMQQIFREEEEDVQIFLSNFFLGWNLEQKYCCILYLSGCMQFLYHNCVPEILSR